MFVSTLASILVSILLWFLMGSVQVTGGSAPDSTTKASAHRTCTHLKIKLTRGNEAIHTHLKAKTQVISILISVIITRPHNWTKHNT